MNGWGWPARYEIRVDSVLDDQWADWFGGLQLSNDGAQTVIVGLLPDQPALHGLLTKIGDLGLSLISVRRLIAGWMSAMPETRRSNDTRSRTGTDRHLVFFPWPDIVLRTWQHRRAPASRTAATSRLICLRASA